MRDKAADTGRTNQLTEVGVGGDLGGPLAERDTEPQVEPET